MRQYTGVFPFKHLIKWIFPEAVAAFDGCAKLHDEAYKTVDWSKGENATLKIDNAFWYCCMNVADDDQKLIADADLFYRVCRKWGKFRAWIWKYGLRY